MIGIRKNSHYTIIAGCGRLGASIAESLSDQGESVLILDLNPESFSRLSPSYCGLTLPGDATDLDVLEQAGIADATAVILVTNKDNINIMTAQLARELSPSAQIIARLYNPDCECVYRRFGIATICPSALSAKEINHLLELSPKEHIA